ncbi:LuxR C-terminal-related transcriptional regulator [Streptomyces sp. NBC_00882]|uniref:LuxR C-terminal-related transcriptional regulator n=1 Tax=Streptomyces sp. NBC_00882 TaxID=2975856 RepID=UPI00386CB114|nr:LuxR C-terminal-related transcriptional regulator [Streptomyces sp. NBC_00882]
MSKGDRVVKRDNRDTVPGGGESVDTDVYRYALSKPAVTSTEVATTLNLSSETADEALGVLLGMGLMRRLEGRVSRFVAVNPEMAAETVLAPLEQTIREQYALVERTRERLARFAPLYEAENSRSEGLAPVELIEDLVNVRAAIARFADDCDEEVLTSQPGGGRKAEVLAEAVGRDERMLKRGVRMRTLYQHTARFSPGTRAYVERVMKLGAEVRTLDDQVMRLLIFDRKIAVIGVRDNVNAAVVLRDVHLVQFAAAVFELVWGRADPFLLRWDNQELAEIGEELKTTIFRLLSEGLTDQVIAKRVGLSVRTCRRHIAEVIQRLGAESRFQAGYMLGSGGWEAVARDSR